MTSVNFHIMSIFFYIENNSNLIAEEEEGEINFNDELSRLKDNFNKTSSIDEQYEKWMEIRHEFIPSDK